jgi:hypothetical protein
LAAELGVGEGGAAVSTRDALGESVPLADVLEHGRAIYAMLTKMIRR